VSQEAGKEAVVMLLAMSRAPVDALPSTAREGFIQDPGCHPQCGAAQTENLQTSRSVAIWRCPACYQCDFDRKITALGPFDPMAKARNDAGFRCHRNATHGGVLIRCVDITAGGVADRSTCILNYDTITGLLKKASEMWNKGKRVDGGGVVRYVGSEHLEACPPWRLVRKDLTKSSLSQTRRIVALTWSS